MKENFVRGDEPQSTLLVEGDDDFHLCYHLLKHYQLEKLISIEDKKGVENLLKSLKVELKLKNRLGIVVDADDDLVARWRAIRARLRVSGYNSIPNSPVGAGTILQEGDLPVVGIWLMPDNKIPGMLEDFVSLLRPQEDVLWPFAVSVVQQVKGIETSLRFQDMHESKARIHTWLAWQREPGKPIGQAITKGYLKADAALAQSFIDWIRELFDLAPVSL
jgi:hypothetical protein